MLVYRGAWVVVNGMSLIAGRGQTKQLHRVAYSITLHTLPLQQSWVYVIILEGVE